METKLNNLFSSSGFSLSAAQNEMFRRYAKLLVEWNKKINLTAIIDEDGICEKHFLDSVLLLKFITLPENSKVIDVGTGAGFPGIPLKIMRSDIKLTLLDSLNKRINFLKAVSDELSLSAECIHARAEEGGKNPTLREKYDLVTARAVAALPVLLEYCLPFVKIGGIFAALKGPNEDISDAKAAVNILGGKILSVNDYNLPSGDSRRLILIEKISQTSTKYPRNSGQISKKSL